MSHGPEFDLSIGSADRSHMAALLAILRKHVGRANAISKDEIERLTEIAGRDVQAIVKFLVEERSYPIGTAWSAPFGYYLIRDEHELALNFKQFLRRGVSNLRHAHAFNRSSLIAPIVGQLELLDDYYRDDAAPTTQGGQLTERRDRPA
ncbi:MAG: hypothetical protein JWO56_2539 [Acidobacteria bacterium]|nr:hypothetical protein [Acidobacteriota bacterium]